MGPNTFLHGALPLQPLVNEDLYSLIVCSKVLKHLGGFPFANHLHSASVQAEYLSTQSCARELWKDDREVNAQFSNKVNSYAKLLCDGSWQESDQRNLCYRVTKASEDLSRFINRLQRNPDEVSFNTPDQTTVNQTITTLPAIQCRMDNFLAGALCPVEFDIYKIPHTETESAQQSCMRINGFTHSARPRCWFAPSLK